MHSLNQLDTISTLFHKLVRIVVNGFYLEYRLFLAAVDMKRIVQT